MPPIGTASHFRFIPFTKSLHARTVSHSAVPPVLITIQLIVTRRFLSTLLMLLYCVFRFATVRHIVRLTGMERIRRGMLPSNNPHAPLTVGYNQNKNGLCNAAELQAQLVCKGFVFPRRMFSCCCTLCFYIVYSISLPLQSP